MTRGKLRNYRCDDALYEAAQGRARAEGRPLSAAVRWLLEGWLGLDDELYAAALRKAKAEGTTLPLVVRALVADWVQPKSLRHHPGRRRTDSGARGGREAS